MGCMNETPNPDHPDHPDIVLCPGGPMLLRSDHVIEDEDGNEHQTTRPVSAVCRCGKSQIKPWCDGTHKCLRKRSDDYVRHVRQRANRTMTPSSKVFVSWTVTAPSPNCLACCAICRTCSVLPSCSSADPPSARCCSMSSTQVRARSNPSSPPSMARTGSAGNLAVSVLRTHGGSAMIRPKRSSV